MRGPGGSGNGEDVLGRLVPLVRAALEAAQAAGAATLEARRAYEEFDAASAAYEAARLRRKRARRRKERATSEAHEVLAACQSAVRSTYRAWREAHPRAPSADHERFFEEIGREVGLPGRQIFRLAGYNPGPRTDEDLWEDYRLYQAGWNGEEIGRFRGISREAVRKGLVKCRVLERPSFLVAKSCN